MQIQVNTLCEDNGRGTLVEFTSPYGSAKGLWKDAVPEVNQSYYAEFEIPIILTWGIDITRADSGGHKIWSDGDQTYFNVKFECFENDGCLAVRLGDSILLVETTGAPYLDALFLTIQMDELHIYPYEL